MKIAFITELDAMDPDVRSGVPFHIYSALVRQNHEVRILRVTDNRTIFQKLVSRLLHIYFNRWLKGKKGLYSALWSTAMSNGYARSIAPSEIEGVNCAITISTAVAAFLNMPFPLLLWIDNTFESFSKNPLVGKLSSITRRESAEVDRHAIRNSFRTFVASHWLKDLLVRADGGLQKKIEVLPRGANISTKPSVEMITQNVKLKKKSGQLKLLFICSNWLTKGGDIVLNTYEILLKKNYPCKLTIIGSISPITQHELEARGVTYLGYIKQSVKDNEAFRKALTESFVLIVPSRADGFGIVYTEAASYGLPSIAFGIMGVTESVKDGVTGVLLDSEATPSEFANEIEKLWLDENKYETLCLSAYRYADENFSWEKNCKKLLSLVP